MYVTHIAPQCPWLMEIEFAAAEPTPAKLCPANANDVQTTRAACSQHR